jgi:hypothetical protein
LKDSEQSFVKLENANQEIFFSLRMTGIPKKLRDKMMVNNRHFSAAGGNSALCENHAIFIKKVFQVFLWKICGRMCV